MNHYAARQKKIEDGDKGLWHYTVANSGYVQPVGYCSPWESCPNCDEHLPPSYNESDCELCKGKRLVKKTDPCPGHITKEEAEEHYKQYVVDRAKFLPKTNEWPKDKCENENCNCEATFTAIADGHMYQFCQTHANKEALTEYIVIGECWSS